MTTPIAPALAVRAGPRHWVRSFAVMARFELTNLRVLLTLALLFQILMGAGMAVIYDFYLSDLPPTARLFVVTGIPALALVPIGLLMVPTTIMQHKLRETYDYVWSLPVPRSASAAATFSVFTVLAVPGTIVALWVATVNFAVDLQMSWSIAPAVLLTSLMTTSVGFGFAHAIPDPRMTNLLTNLVVFAVLLFSPIVVPIEQFPDWLATLHRWLPFYHMAVVTRAGLSEGLITSPLLTSYLVLGAWTAAAWALAGWVVGRRR